jgi:hypothetical protein
MFVPFQMSRPWLEKEGGAVRWIVGGGGKRLSDGRHTAL